MGRMDGGRGWTSALGRWLAGLWVGQSLGFSQIRRILFDDGGRDVGMELGVTMCTVYMIFVAEGAEMGII